MTEKYECGKLNRWETSNNVSNINYITVSDNKVEGGAWLPIFAVDNVHEEEIV